MISRVIRTGHGSQPSLATPCLCCSLSLTSTRKPSTTRLDMEKGTFSYDWSSGTTAPLEFIPAKSIACGQVGEGARIGDVGPVQGRGARHKRMISLAVAKVWPSCENVRNHPLSCPESVRVSRRVSRSHNRTSPFSKWTANLFPSGLKAEEKP